ncbi:hypothetical protein [Roseovarius sp. EL26]|uniref:hypothetical protein n=1 Tax=Roseovarius sp. EL26 TaxID=2126672 RepID=UPI000EA09BE3|nr:hypothetical protein [Roseovarius sp. EL26]
MPYSKISNPRVRAEYEYVLDSLNHVRPKCLLDFRNRALLATSYGAGIPIEKLLKARISDITGIELAMSKQSERSVTFRNALKIDGRCYVLMDSPVRRISLWVKKLKTSISTTNADIFLFPATKSSSEMKLKNSAICSEQARNVFKFYFGKNRFRDFRHLRIAGTAYLLSIDIHPRAVRRVAGYSHIRSIKAIADSYGIEISRTLDFPPVCGVPAYFNECGASFSKLVNVDSIGSLSAQ